MIFSCYNARPMTTLSGGVPVLRRVVGVEAGRVIIYRPKPSHRATIARPDQRTRLTTIAMGNSDRRLVGVKRRRLFALLGIGVGALILVSGWRSAPPRVLANSPPICGTIYQNEKPVSNGGPCPTVPSETPVGGGWVWEPFWLD